ncbi:MAG: CHASE domain-containing protein [Planctomycetota bacterium]
MGLAVLVGLIGLAVTFFASRHEFEVAHREDLHHFQQLNDRVTAEVQRQISLYHYGLMGTRSVFAASNDVDGQAFLHLVQSREMEKEFPGALGIGYIHRVPDDGQALDAFLDQARGEVQVPFEVSLPPGAAALPGTPTGDRYITKYIEPLARNQPALGLDIGAHAVRREAADRAMRTGEAALTGTIHLVQDQSNAPGFLYMLPVYQRDAPLETERQRIDALVGWVYMPLLGPDVFQGLTEAANREVDVHVFDGTILTADTLIYDSAGNMQKNNLTIYNNEDMADRLFHDTREIEIGGRVWTVTKGTNDNFTLVPRTTAWLVLFGGSIMSVLAGLLVHVLGTTTARALTMADSMTADLRAYADAARQATQAKSAFLANMSHEIRTPMTAILGYAELLEAQIDHQDHEVLSYTETIRRNGNHLISIINDVLDLSKIEAGKFTVERVDTDPRQLVCDVLSLMQVKASAKSIRLEATCTSPVPERIKTDPLRLRQVLVNLVGNAIKFTKVGGVGVEIGFDNERDLLVLNVTDSGCGMSPEQVDKLFRPFTQADESTSRKHGGTGLGLHISKRLAELLGGQISCVSTLGKGSRFQVTLQTGDVQGVGLIQAGPVQAVEVDRRAASDRARPAGNAQSSQAKRLDGFRVLLAEDGPDNQRLINYHLTKAGARVTIAENGRVAVEQLTSDGTLDGALTEPPVFDVMFCDMQMPEMDGYTAVSLLREKGSTLPIIALTAHAMSGDDQKCYDAGCDAYATKPIDRETLVRVCLEARPAKTAA